jgi:hypothetical protein
MANRIPTKDNLFLGYIVSSTAYLLAEPTPGNPNWVRLGLTSDEKTSWDNFEIDWVLTYPKYLDPGQRTKAITTHKNNIRKNFTAFASPILNRLQPQATILTELDRTTLNLPVHDTTPSPKGAITGVPVNDIIALGGGTMRIKARTSEDASRASRHPLADAIEVRYSVRTIASGNAEPEPGNTGSNTPPETPEECPNTFSSTKANFKLVLGTSASGKKVYGFTRWINQKNPANNGEWGAMFQAVVV